MAVIAEVDLKFYLSDGKDHLETCSCKDHSIFFCSSHMIIAFT